MAEEEEFKIKGAARKADVSDENRTPDEVTVAEEDKAAKQAGDAQAVESNLEKTQSKDAIAGDDLSDEQKYRWFKCRADEKTFGKDAFYFVHADSQESQWTEPTQPYWIFDEQTGKADSKGLQIPRQSTDTHDIQQPNLPEDWKGYNPKIHGNYDPNADYARYHEGNGTEGDKTQGTFESDGTTVQIPEGQYESTMATNRFTGNAQISGAGPERHSDAAKSGRQMNAFFDVDAAANAHDGRSLKEERKAQKLSKSQVQAFNKARHEKKQKKRLAFYKS